MLYQPHFSLHTGLYIHLQVVSILFSFFYILKIVAGVTKGSYRAGKTSMKRKRERRQGYTSLRFYKDWISFSSTTPHGGFASPGVAQLKLAK